MLNIIIYFGSFGQLAFDVFMAVAEPIPLGIYFFKYFCQQIDGIGIQFSPYC
jgi:hypothetical protein